jgi:hypothetical protein
MTCRLTFVLATDQLSREWAYEALSRGAESNRLYVLEDASPERLEYAPGSERPGGLVARLMRSEAQELAPDQDTDRQPDGAVSSSRISTDPSRCTHCGVFEPHHVAGRELAVAPRRISGARASLNPPTHHCQRASSVTSCGERAVASQRALRA